MFAAKLLPAAFVLLAFVAFFATAEVSLNDVDELMTPAAQDAPVSKAHTHCTQHSVLARSAQKGAHTLVVAHVWEARGLM